jgi:cytochrome c oxidase assembly factor CtaG
VPWAWLIFAQRPVYRVYDTAYRMGSIDAVTDQQLAGVLMKLGAGFFLWSIIFVTFFKWSRHQEAERLGVLVSDRDVLTWDEVQTELTALERRGPAPAEPT